MNKNANLSELDLSELSAIRELQRRRVSEINESHKQESNLLQEIDEVLIEKRLNPLELLQ